MQIIAEGERNILKVYYQYKQQSPAPLHLLPSILNKPLGYTYYLRMLDGWLPDDDDVDGIIIKSTMHVHSQTSSQHFPVSTLLLYPSCFNFLLSRVDGWGHLNDNLIQCCGTTTEKGRK